MQMSHGTISEDQNLAGSQLSVEQIYVGKKSFLMTMKTMPNETCFSNKGQGTEAG